VEALNRAQGSRLEDDIHRYECAALPSLSQATRSLASRKRPRAHDRLCAAEEVLDLKEILVARGRRKRVFFALVGNTVGARLLDELARVELE